MKIQCFILDSEQKKLAVQFSGDLSIHNTELSYEYLRISSPGNTAKNTKSGQVAPVSHKKEVVLTHIESVAKHGYRLIFDDGHNTIYSEEFVQTLVHEYEERWHNYLNELTTSGHSRETMIDFKQL